MNVAEIIGLYEQHGFATEHITDEPGKIYEPHAHHRTYLLTLAGSVAIRQGDNDWQTLQPFKEYTVETGIEHEAVVGDEGWAYIAAWDPIEAEQYKDVKH